MGPAKLALWVIYDSGDGGYWSTHTCDEEAYEHAHEINTSGRYRFTGPAKVARFTLTDILPVMVWDRKRREYVPEGWPQATET